MTVEIRQCRCGSSDWEILRKKSFPVPLSRCKRCGREGPFWPDLVVGESTTDATLTPADALRECGLDVIADRMRAVARRVEQGAEQIAEWKSAGDWRGDVDWESLAEAVPPGWWLAEDSHGHPGWWLHQLKPEWDGAAWISGGDITRPSRSLAWQYDVDSKDTLVQRPWLPSDVLRVWEAAT